MRLSGVGDAAAGRSRLRRAAVLLALSVSTAALGERLAPGEPIIAAAETATLVLAGAVGEVERIDARTRKAMLRVEQVLFGAAGDEQMIAWQEPANREPRFAAGERVLVALEPLPASSSWRDRPAAAGALAVAGGGYALLSEPSAADIAGLTAYLQLDAGARRGVAGLSRLTDLVAVGQPGLAAAALRHLRSAAALPSAGDLEKLAAVAAATERPRALRVAVLDYFRDRRVGAVRTSLEPLARPASDVDAEAMDAIAAIDGGLDEATAQRLLAAPDPRHRAVGARWAPESLAQRALPEVARSDADPGVRAAAAAALAATATSWGLAAAVDALADPAPQVRGAAVQAIARLGAPAVAALDAEIAADSAATPGAIAALSQMGKAGRPSLLAASKSPHARVRALAELALGRIRDEHH